MLESVTHKHPSVENKAVEIHPISLAGQGTVIPQVPAHPSPGTEAPHHLERSAYAGIKGSESLLAHCERTTDAPWPGFDMYFYFPAVFTYQEQVTGKVV